MLHFIERCSQFLVVVHFRMLGIGEVFDIVAMQEELNDEFVHLGIFGSGSK